MDSKRQAEASRKSERAKKQKIADQQAEHAVEHEVDGVQDVTGTISLSNNDDSSGIGNGQEQPEGILLFDNVFKDAHFCLTTRY